MGIRILDLHTIEAVDTATRSELMEGSVCPIPSDSGAIVLYDENRKVLTYEEVRLSFNNQQKPTEMEGKKETLTAEQQLDAKDQEIAQLKAEIAQNRKDAVSSYLDAAVASGKITAEEKEDFQKLSESDFETVKKIIDAKQPKASQSLKDLAAQSAAHSERADWTYLDWMKKDSKGLARMKTENPTEFARLQATLKH